jgi:hypothetical protein
VIGYAEGVRTDAGANPFWTNSAGYFAASNAATIEPGRRPRPFTLWPWATAQARTSAVDGAERRAERGADERLVDVDRLPVTPRVAAASSATLSETWNIDPTTRRTSSIF